MGVCKSKPKPRESLLTARQRQSLAAMFRNSEEMQEPPPITKLTMSAIWHGILTPHLMNLFLEYLFKTDKTIQLEDLENFYYNMVEGQTENRAAAIMAMLGTNNSIHPQIIHKYVMHLLRSYMNILNRCNHTAFNSWRHGDSVCEKDLHVLTDYCMKGIIYSESGMMELNELERWLIVCSFMREVFESIIHYLFNMNVGELKPTLPEANGQTSMLRVPLVLLLSHLTQIYTKRVWRTLYDSWTDPHSWVILQLSIINQGPNLIIVEESGGFVFGGFASQSWRINTGFFGDSGCFLFRLRPDIIVCASSPINKHYQYLFDGQGMFPKGLAFGGYLNYFGLFLNPDFGPGQVSETCDTYLDYEPLSEEKNFYFTRLEAWGISDAEPKRVSVENEPKLVDPKRFDDLTDEIADGFEGLEKWKFL